MGCMKVGRILDLGHHATTIPHDPVASAIVMAGCTSTAYTPEPPTPTPSPTPIPAPTSTPVPASAPDAAYDPNRTMWRIFGGPDPTFEALELALDDAVAANDVSQAPIIVEIMRFSRTPVVYREALLSLTGQDFWTAPHPWHAAMEWLGPRRDEFPPPEGYLDWKANFLSFIDPRMAAFFTSVPGSERIDLTEVVWGACPPMASPTSSSLPRSRRKKRTTWSLGTVSSASPSTGSTAPTRCAS